MNLSRALILAAGRGERMRPLTDATPKPLLAVRGRPLLQWWLEALQDSGADELVINTAWLGQQVEDWATRWQAQQAAAPRLHFSPEGRDFGGALETAGGIARALPWLAPHAGDVFAVVAGDIYAPGFRFDPDTVQRFIAGGKLAHLWLVPNPPHKLEGDFGLDADGLLRNLPAPDPAVVAGPTGSTPLPGRPKAGSAPSGGSATDEVVERGGLTTLPPGRPKAGSAPSGGSATDEVVERGGSVFTFAAIGLYRRSLFELPWSDIPPGNRHGAAARLAPLLRKAAAAGQVSAELYLGTWTDVGTPERLAQLNATSAADDGT